MDSAGDEKGSPSHYKAFDVSGRVQNRGDHNRLERGERKTKCLSWKKASGADPRAADSSRRASLSATAHGGQRDGRRNRVTPETADTE